MAFQICQNLFFWKAHLISTINMSSMPNGHPSAFPPVKLYTTLHDLYLDVKEGPLEETLCVIKPNSDPNYGEVVPFNSKYTIHSAQVGTGIVLTLSLHGILILI